MNTRRNKLAVVTAILALLLVTSVALATLSVTDGPYVNLAVDGVDITGVASLSPPNSTMCIRLDSGHASAPTVIETDCQTQPQDNAGNFSCNIPQSELVDGQQLNYSLVGWTGNSGCTGSASDGGSYSFTPTAIELASLNAAGGGSFLPVGLLLLGLLALGLISLRLLQQRRVDG
ncbi:MAG: hypothetical protein ACK2UK_01380 [Candidatus Promineifilaceae bacterium]